MNNIVKVKYLRFFSLTTQQTCLVCIKTIGKFADTLTDEDKTSSEKIEKAFKTFCSKVKVDSKEHRLVNSNDFHRISSIDFPLVLLYWCIGNICNLCNR